MSHRALSHCLPHGSRPKSSAVFNNLSTILFRRASSNTLEVPSAAQDGDYGSKFAATGTKKVIASDLAFDSENIIIGDLAATLEAHRASNRAKASRMLVSPSPKDTDLKNDAGHGSFGLQTPHESRANASSRAISGLELAPAKPSPLVRRTRGKRSPSLRHKPQSGKIRRGSHNEQDDIEYTARNCHAQGRWSQRVLRERKMWRSHRPWLAYVDSVHEDCLDRLSSEVRALDAYMRLTPTEEESAKLIVSDALSALEGDFAPDQIEMLGSRSTGLATPLSDFDFSIIPKLGQGPAVAGGTLSGKDVRGIVDDVLYRTEEALRAAPQFKSVRRIYARVQIVRAIHRHTGCPIEFQTMTSFYASQAQTKAWLRDIPSLRSLFITMRLFLEILELNKVFQGGIGSYTLIVMIVTASKHANDTHDPKDLGGQLLHVLSFWGWADLYKYAYSADPPMAYRKPEKSAITYTGEAEGVHQASGSQLEGMNKICLRDDRRPFLLCLQDPANHINDLGANSHAIRTIQAIFRIVHQKLSSFVHMGKPSRPESDSRAQEENSKWARSVLYEMLRADFNSFEVLRSCLERHVDPKRRVTPKRVEKTTSLEQQVRAIEYRKRHGLTTLFSEPKASLGDWTIALGLRNRDRAAPIRSWRPEIQKADLEERSHPVIPPKTANSNPMGKRMVKRKFPRKVSSSVSR